MVDLGVATTEQLSEAVEISFEKLEAQFRRESGSSTVGWYPIYNFDLIRPFGCLAIAFSRGEWEGEE